MTRLLFNLCEVMCFAKGDVSDERRKQSVEEGGGADNEGVQ